jgi:hypothetical protein
VAESQAETQSTQVSWVVAPAPEEQPQTKLFQYVVECNGKMSQEAQHRIDKVNGIFEGIASFHSWSQKHLSEPNVEGLSTKKRGQWFNKLAGETQQHMIVLDTMRSLLVDADNKSEIAKEPPHEPNVSLTDTLPDIPKKPIKLAKEEEVDVLCHKLHGILHDIANPFNAFTFATAPDFPKDADTITIVKEAFQQMNTTIENGNNLVVDNYPKKEVSLLDLQKYLKSPSMGVYGIKSTVADIPKENVKVRWSSDWFAVLFDNIVQNDIRYADRSPITISFQVNKNPPRVDIVFDDQGKGYSPDIIQNGFAYGKSAGLGQGIAMAFHADILEKHYGGKLIPTNRFDESGKIIGGRLIVRLPMTSAPQVRSRAPAANSPLGRLNYINNTSLG